MSAFLCQELHPITQLPIANAQHSKQVPRRPLYQLEALTQKSTRSMLNEWTDELAIRIGWLADTVYVFPFSVDQNACAIRFLRP